MVREPAATHEHNASARRQLRQPDGPTGGDVTRLLNNRIAAERALLLGLATAVSIRAREHYGPVHHREFDLLRRVHRSISSEQQ